MEKFKNILKLFITFFKIGLFTFGGGYAMIAILQSELVEKKKWVNEEDFYNVVSIAESTPGPVAINMATFLGYKRAGVLGSLFSTLGVVLPSFIIIFIISQFFDAFLKFKYVQYAFKGIQACVGYLILNAGLKMIKGLKSPIEIALLCASFLALVLFTLFSISFSSIFYVLIGGLVGLTAYAISLIVKKSKSDKGDNK
ncbi:MAG: chromate transporter [Clostridia bacterium]|nr:chromate transporter [Clostridia bacterium]